MFFGISYTQRLALVALLTALCGGLFALKIFYAVRGEPDPTFDVAAGGSAERRKIRPKNLLAPIHVYDPLAAPDPGDLERQGSSESEKAANSAALKKERGEIANSAEYPPLARLMQWTGAVLVQVWLDANGKIEKAGLAQSSGHQVLDAAALKAVNSWKFQNKKYPRPYLIQFDFELVD